MTPFEKVSITKVAVYARLLGFVPFGQSKSARKHFHWYMPDTDDTFTVRQLKGSSFYTVNNQTTSRVELALEWLKEIERIQAHIEAE